ncbi:MAG: YraN family protein [Thermoanaerobacterales bacterium]|jgi:putative endonuclease|nr:YraN family protein [Thermoanaerobacterales bacterium]
MNKRKLGLKGERCAADYLLLHGYKILAQNYRCLYGEIDIIALKMNTIVFVEVKTRTSGDYGMGIEAVNHFKQQRIRKAAMCYLSESKARYKALRFDVIGIFMSGDKTQLTHIQNAF